MLVWIILIVILIFLILAGLAVDWMTRYAYDRKSPKLPKFLVNIIMGNQPVDEEKRRAIRSQAEQLKEKASVKCEMRGFDGVPLTGHYYPCKNPERIVIAAHGWRSGWNYDYRTIAPFLHENQTAVLMIDLRGHGDSGDRYLYYGKKERFDIAGWTSYAAENLACGVPIYVMGMSAGALSTLMSTASGLHENTKGAILDSCAASARVLGHSVVRNMGLNPKVVYPFIRLDARIRMGIDDNAYTGFDALKENRLPILFIHGTKDQVADIHSMEELYDNCKTPRFKLIVEGAGHTQSCFTDPEAYQNALLSFFAFCETDRSL
ncbi:MAG: alpha/beta fold hydrolase [Parasporobacterium sp.]|nr:alpha/beta fold hydrolase [Parasporobacterium sp.]